MSTTSADLPALLPNMLPRLWAFALRLCGDRHDAEDLVQLACARALERAHQLQPDTTPLSWMFAIVQNLWINEIRARDVRRRTHSAWDPQVIESVADPGITPEHAATLQQVINAVDTLPQHQREVMLLVTVECFSYQEAADILGVPTGTIMSRLSRARHTINRLFDEAPRPATARHSERCSGASSSRAGQPMALPLPESWLESSTMNSR